MRIRTLQSKEDIRDVVRINRNAWREAYTELLPDKVLNDMTTEASEEEIETRFEQLRDHKDRFFLAEDDEERVQGYAHFRWNPNQTKEFVGEDQAGLKVIYVDPAHWGEGIGTTLLEHGIDNIPPSKSALVLEMLSGNQVGKEFYESQGFRQIDTAETEINGSVYQTDIFILELD